MTSQTEKHRRHQHGATPSAAAVKLQQEADFTSEGSPPPGRVGTDHPALPRTGQAESAESAKSGADPAGVGKG